MLALRKMSLGSWTPTCSWLFAGIQSLSLPGLVQLPNPNHFPQGWRGKEGLEQAGRGDREGERMEWGRGCWGAGCRRPTGSGQSQLGQRTRSGMDKCLGCPENKDRASSLCASPLLSFQQHRLWKTLSLLFRSLHRVRCCSQASGRRLDRCIQEEAV